MVPSLFRRCYVSFATNSFIYADCLRLANLLTSMYGLKTSVVKAGFGVDGELRANYFNNIVQSGNDDWFNNGTAGTGAFVIDTTGAAAMLARYAIDPAFRQLPFYRTMKYPAYSVVNSKLLLDAIFIRDYHGTDSTIFANGASKNGDSPADWSCPVAGARYARGSATTPARRPTRP